MYLNCQRKAWVLSSTWSIHPEAGSFPSLCAPLPGPTTPLGPLLVVREGSKCHYGPESDRPSRHRRRGHSSAAQNPPGCIHVNGGQCNFLVEEIKVIIFYFICLFFFSTQWYILSAEVRLAPMTSGRCLSTEMLLRMPSTSWFVWFLKAPLRRTWPLSCWASTTPQLWTCTMTASGRH